MDIYSNSFEFVTKPNRIDLNPNKTNSRFGSAGFVSIGFNSVRVRHHFKKIAVCDNFVQGVINDKLEWIGGKTYLVMIGDLVDGKARIDNWNGDSDLKVINFLGKLINC